MSLTMVSGGTYSIQAHDINGCIGSWPDNPIDLIAIAGPQLNDTLITDPIDGQANGIIEILATANSAHISYSIDNGSNWQSDNGYFSGLPAGTYFCIIKDDYGCTYEFQVELVNIIQTWLDAIVSPEDTCMGVAVSVPMEVDNFTAVASFRLKLTYNAAQLNCEGYSNLRPELSDGFQAVISTPGEITLDWNGTTGLSFTGQTAILELVFSPLQAGSSDIDWSTQAADSYFKRIDGSAISAQFSPGE